MDKFTPWLGICHVRQLADDSVETRPTLAAVWTDSAKSFEREIHVHTSACGLQAIWVENILPAGEWLAKNPLREDALKLSRMISERHSVELGAIGAGVTRSQMDDVTESYLCIEEIEGVAPLDMQFGMYPPKTVPDVLYEPLFGQPEPTTAEVAQYGRVDAVPPLNTYAILDAAKVVNFAEMLEASGLEYRCLFKGAAEEELRNVAPYLVRLEEGNKFTRSLFSKNPDREVSWFMWDKEPGIYMRSRGSLEDMWKHFRKLTRVQDENGKWYYFRFWEPLLLITYLEEKSGCMRISQIIPKRANLILTDSALCQVVILKQAAKTVKKGDKIALVAEDFELMKRYKNAQDSRIVMRELYYNEGRFYHENGLTIVQCVEFVSVAIGEAKSISLLKKEHIMRFIVLCEKCGIGFIHNVKYGNVQRTVGSGFVPSRTISELEYDVKEIFEDDK